MQSSPWLFVVGGLSFVFVWCAVCWVLAFVGGWRRLAGRFRATGPRPIGKNFWMMSGAIGGTTFRGALNVTVAPQGLYMSAFPLFRAGHPPLLVPWTVFKPFREEKMLWLSTYETDIALDDFDTVTLSVWSRELKEAMHAQAYAALHPVSAGRTNEV